MLFIDVQYAKWLLYGLTLSMVYMWGLRRKNSEERTET